jgi:hypothetical protein
MRSYPPQPQDEPRSVAKNRLCAGEQIATNGAEHLTPTDQPCILIQDLASKALPAPTRTICRRHHTRIRR